MSPERAVQAYVYWDYSCPFSYVATRRLRRLAEERPLRLHWRPFEVHGGLPEEGIPAKELGYAPDRWARALSAVEEMAREEGMELDVPDFVPRTSEALQAALFARDVGRPDFRRLHGALFRAYFVEGRNIGLRPTVLETAGSAGVDREGLERALEDERYAEDVRSVQAEAERYDIDGTPTVLFGRFKVVGAAPMEVLREAADRAVREADRGEGDREGAERADGGEDDGEGAERGGG